MSRARVLAAAVIARASGTVAELTRDIQKRALRGLAKDLFRLAPGELAQRRAAALASALRGIYSDVDQIHFDLLRKSAGAAGTRTANSWPLSVPLSQFLLALLTDIRLVLALRRASSIPPDLKAHLLIRDPGSRPVAHVVARTTREAAREHEIEHVPFPPARLALERPIHENWIGIVDVPRWVGGDRSVVWPSENAFVIPEDFAKLWASDPRVVARYGAAIVFQIPKPEECLPEPTAAWPHLARPEPVAAVCIDCPTPNRWTPDENDVLLSVAMPYLATVRHAVAALGLAGGARPRSEPEPK